MKLIIVENYEEASIEAAKVMLEVVKTIQLLIWDWLRDLHQSECMN